MGAGNNQLSFAIRAVNEAEKALKDVRQQISDVDQAAVSAGGPTGSVNRMGSAVGGLKTAMTGIVLSAGITTAAGFFTSAAQAAAEDEAATARLEQAVRNASGAFDENLPKVQDRITKGQELGFTDDAIRNSLVGLIAATGSVDESLARNTLAMDVARGAGISLEAASKLLGKVTEENVEQFKRMGITIGEGATEAEAFGALQEKFGGQAKTYAESSAGQMEVAKIKIGEAKESIGAGLIPVMGALATILVDKVIPAIDPFLTLLAENDAAAIAFAGTVTGLLVVAFVAWTVSAAAAAAATIAATWPVLAIIVAIAALAVGIIYLYTHWDELRRYIEIFLLTLGPLPMLIGLVSANFETLTSWVGAAKEGFVAMLGPIQWVIDKVGALISIIRAIPSIPSLPGGGGFNPNNLPGDDPNSVFRAGGGPVDAGRPYIVGEQGVELFIPQRSGMIVPNHALRSGGSGGGGGRAIEIHFHGFVGDVRELARVLEGEFGRRMPA